MVIDHEAVLADLKAFIASKPHHGSRDLALRLAELEGEHRLDEEAPERAFRMYGVRLREDLRAAARNDPPEALDGSPPSGMRDESGHRPKRRKESIDDGSIREGHHPPKPRS